MHRVVFSEMSASSQKLIGSSQSGRRGRFLTKTLLQISRKSWVSEVFLTFFFFFFLNSTHINIIINISRRGLKVWHRLLWQPALVPTQQIKIPNLFTLTNFTPTSLLPLVYNCYTGVFSFQGNGADEKSWGGNWKQRWLLVLLFWRGGGEGYGEWFFFFDCPKHCLFLVHFCTVSVMLKKIIPFSFTVLVFL